MPLAWQYNILVLENLAANQADGIALVNRPVQGELLDRMIQRDAINVFPNFNIQTEQMAQFDGLRFALGNNVGVGPEVLFLSDRMILQDAFHNPNIFLTQMVRELVMLPTSTAVRLTQMVRELVMLPSSTNIRLTQMVRELVMLYPEAFTFQEDLLMNISDQVFLQDTVKGQIAGLFFLNIGERNSPGMFDQSGQDNVKLKKNVQIKASNLVTGDTTLNHWLDAITATVIPGNTAQSFSDQLTLSDALTTKLPVNLTELLSDQTPLWADAETQIMTMQQPFIQTLNLWQEFFAQPFLGIFAEVLNMTDSLATFAAYFGNFSDQIAMQEQVIAGYGDILNETMTMADAVVIAEQLNELLAETLNIIDSMLLGYGFIISDVESLNDSMLLGYGDLFSDTNVMSDSMSSGYGSGTSDQLNMAESLLVGYGDLIAEQMILTELWQIGTTTVSASDVINFFVEQLIVGFGLQIAEQDASWAESILMMTEDDLMVIEGMTQTDSMGAGYGMQPQDSLGTTDMMLLGYGSLMSDQSTMSDFALTVVGSPIIISDALVILDAILTGIGLLMSEQLVFEDEYDAFSAYGIALGDQDLSWLEFVRTISAMEFRTYYTFFVVTASSIKASPRVNTKNLSTYLVQA